MALRMRNSHPSATTHSGGTDADGGWRSAPVSRCYAPASQPGCSAWSSGPEPNQYSDFKDFLDTKPLLFKEVEEPLQADEWLNTIEQKFRLLRLTEELKTEYASHQLHGPAGIWWSHYRPTRPPNVQINWDQFKVAFHGNYIPPGLMAMKHTEFM
jgi:hypothetical protein